MRSNLILILILIASLFFTASAKLGMRHYWGVPGNGGNGGNFGNCGNCDDRRHSWYGGSGIDGDGRNDHNGGDDDW